MGFGYSRVDLIWPADVDREAEQRVGDLSLQRQHREAINRAKGKARADDAVVVRVAQRWRSWGKSVLGKSDDR